MIAGSSTSDPRPTLQKNAPGFMAANAAASMRAPVSDVSGTAAMTASHIPSIVCSSAAGNSSSTSGAVSPGFAERRVARTRMPSACARAAIAELIAPRPISPSVHPAS